MDSLRCVSTFKCSTQLNLSSVFLDAAGLDSSSFFLGAPCESLLLEVVLNEFDRQSDKLAIGD